MHYVDKMQFGAYTHIIGTGDRKCRVRTVEPIYSGTYSADALTTQSKGLSDLCPQNTRRKINTIWNDIASNDTDDVFAVYTLTTLLSHDDENGAHSILVALWITVDSFYSLRSVQLTM